MSESQPIQKTARRLVLVADDEPAYHLVMAHVLAAFDLIPLVANDGAAAITLAKAHKEGLRRYP